MGSNENPVPHHETPTCQFPNVITAPATDVSTQPFFWSSFNISPRRQQRGGRAREVTQADFAISDEFAPAWRQQRRAEPADPSDRTRARPDVPFACLLLALGIARVPQPSA